VAGTRKNFVALSLAAVCAAAAQPARAAASELLTGEILGEVRNAAGVAQMGATVLLYNRYEQRVRQTLTNESGRFAFDALTPDLYSVRVSLASFVPAIRRNIAVLAGSERLLKINLASVLSSIELAPLATPSGTLMSDEWKWVLRASQATRPVLRVLPGPAPVPAVARHGGSVFSDTTGELRISAGGTDPLSGALQQDLGTAFGVATSIHGRSRVRVSGNLGYTPVSGLPSAAFRATYSRDSDGGRGPQLALTARQVYLPVMIGSGVAGSIIGPALRTASMTAVDRIDLADTLRLEYGVSLESISYQGRLNYMSTFGRATYEAGAFGTVKLAYSSATDPEDLIPRDQEAAADLNRDLSALSKLPRISRREGRTTVQRNQSYEAGYSVVDGSRTYTASAYMEDVSNAGFLMSGSLDWVSREDMLADLNSRGVILNAGNYRRAGYTVAVTQAVGDRLEVTVAGGSSGALLASPLSEETSQGEELRGSFRVAPRPWFTARASASLPVTGTHLGASYGWTDFRALTPVHYSLTGKATQEIGWNLALRQPLPGFGGMRMEAAAELRNLLAQGYLPISAGGRQSILTNSPRGVRGGLSFIF
jgi:hypothetical protein